MTKKINIDFENNMFAYNLDVIKESPRYIWCESPLYGDVYRLDKESRMVMSKREKNQPYLKVSVAIRYNMM